MVKHTTFLLYSPFKYRCAMIHSKFSCWLVILLESSFGQAMLGENRYFTFHRATRGGASLLSMDQLCSAARSRVKSNCSGV